MPLSEVYFRMACEAENKAYGNGEFRFFIDDKALRYAHAMLNLAMFYLEYLDY